MKRSFLAALALLLAVLALGTAAGSASTPVTIGQTDATADYACYKELDLQLGVASGTGFVVPAGNQILTSWSTYAGNLGGSGGSMSMMVVRPAGPGSYTVIGESPVESLTASSLNTFTLANPIAVQGGDLLGFWADGGAACATATGLLGDVNPFSIGITQPAVGTTFGTTAGSFGYRLNISATLTALPTTKDQCKKDGWQTFGVFKNEGDCVSAVATG